MTLKQKIFVAVESEILFAHLKYLKFSEAYKREISTRFLACSQMVRKEEKIELHFVFVGAEKECC